MLPSSQPERIQHLTAVVSKLLCKFLWKHSDDDNDDDDDDDDDDDFYKGIMIVVLVAELKVLKSSILMDPKLCTR